jgi:hypothetical protein
MEVWRSGVVLQAWGRGGINGERERGKKGEMERWKRGEMERWRTRATRM